jgi:rsbT co-antagonist protein RsbR
MFPQVHRLGSKLLLTTIVFLVVLATVTSMLLTRGFRQTQQDATNLSRVGLETQGTVSLAALAQREAEVARWQLQGAITAGQHAAQMMSTFIRVGGSVPSAEPDQLVRGSHGVTFDPNPQRHSEIWVPNYLTSIDQDLARDIRASASLETLFSALIAQYPNAVAVYYIHPRGFARYYPVIGLADISPPDYRLTDQPFYTVAAPEANPSRATRWTKPYLDPVGQGLMITASTPVYDGDTFHGVIGVDVSLARLSDYLGKLKPTPNSYALLADQQGKLVAASSAGLDNIMAEPSQTTQITATLGLDLATVTDAAFRPVLPAMRSGKSGVERIDLHGRLIFLSYAPLSDLGWSLVLATPVEDITGQAAMVETAIRRGTDTTVWSTLTAMAGFFLLAVLGMMIISQRFARRITTLVEGTRTVASGNFSMALPVASRDELGVLADAFNQMARMLQQRSNDLEAQYQIAQSARVMAETAQARSEAQLATIEQQQTTIREMSVPVLPLSDRTFIMPLIGVLDPARLDLIETAALRALERSSAQTLLLDITGVPAVDTTVARGLVQVANAVQLLGAEVILVGITPAVAQALVGLGLDLARIKACASLQEGIAYADASRRTNAARAYRSTRN